MYSCLFIKTWVVYGIFKKAAQLKKVTIEPFYILKVLACFLVVEIVSFYFIFQIYLIL